MQKKNRDINNTTVNKCKLIFMPLFIGFLSIIFISTISYYTSKRVLLSQMEDDGITLAKQTAFQVEDNAISLQLINKVIEDKIKVVASAARQNEKLITNDYFKKMASEMNIDEINYFSSKGQVLSSNIDDYIGRYPSKGHPVETFRLSGLDEFMENIRKDSESNNYNKYGYLRNTNGTFIQVGISSSEIEKISWKFNYQNLIEKLNQNENITNVFLIDKNLKTIANSSSTEIGIVYDKIAEIEMSKALNGLIVTKKNYDKDKGENSLSIYIPVLINGEISNALIICLSTEKVYSTIYTTFVKSTIISILVLLLLLFVQYKNIINPINKLDQRIKQIDIEKNITYRLPLSKNENFFGVVASINNILDKTNKYFCLIKNHEEELQASNKEISATYEELSLTTKELRSQYEHIQHMSYHDALTNLPNRNMFMKILEEQLSKNRSGAVLLLDLDNFKGINDTLGHTYGDKILKNIAEILTHIEFESMFVSRFGGDEFFILLQDEKDIDKIEAFANNIINLLTNNLLVEGEKVYISCSIGITLYPFDSSDADQLLMNADMSMYKVKNSGKNNYMFFNLQMTESLQVQIKIEKLLRDVIEQNEFKLLYQPQICVSTGSIIGFEALLRLKNHAISPAQFIPVAEETGSIIEIGRWVTRETIKQIALWRDKGLGLKPIAINFSAKQLNDVSYVSFLKSTLKEFNVDAKYIDIEITESIFLEKKEETIKFLYKLKELGVKIALDDFGTGYSSLSYLTFLPVDKIKLDKSLNDKFLEHKSLKVMDSLISLAHSLNLEVVAEGIEDIHHFNRLKTVGCNYIQGYLFSRPLESYDAEKVYNDNFLDKLLLKN